MPGNSVGNGTFLSSYITERKYILWFPCYSLSKYILHNSHLYPFVNQRPLSHRCNNRHSITSITSMFLESQDMSEVTRYCFCCSNLLSAKILGGLGIAATVINLIRWVILVASLKVFHPILVLPLVFYMISVISNTCVVVGATKKKKSFLTVWFVLSTIALVLCLFAFVKACVDGDQGTIGTYFIVIGLTTWTMLVVQGACEEIKNEVWNFYYRPGRALNKQSTVHR